LSDYDGTLCPTSHIDSQDGDSGLIPTKLEDILVNISSAIPICIISSKDFYFLYKRVRKFSKIISCVLGIETLFMEKASKMNDIDLMVTGMDKLNLHTNSIVDTEIDKFSIFRHLLVDYENIIENSSILKEISSFLEALYPFINVQKKFLTVGKDVIGGITIDWRNDKNDDWVSDALKYKKMVKESIYKAFKKSEMVSNKNYDYYLKKFFIQEYATHPFIDMYGTKTNKGDAYDCVISEISNLNNDGTGKVLYLGDSENDNPAFRKADISIGINSDIRLRPDLKCKYNLNYQDLPNFLRKLSQNNFEFHTSLLT